MSKSTFFNFFAGLLVGLSCIIGVSYAASYGSIGGLFLNGTYSENGGPSILQWIFPGGRIQDGTVTTYELADGTISLGDISAATQTALKDNLGNHRATQNIVLGSKWLSGDGGNEGISVNSSGDVGTSRNLSVLGNTAVSGTLGVTGDINAAGNMGVSGTLGVSGNINVIGDGAIAGNVAVSQHLNVIGNVENNGSMRTAGNIVIVGNATAGAYYYSSDERLKKNIHTFENANQTVGKLRGVSFDWKKTGKHDVGVIAQEVEEVLPELVQTDPETGYKSVEYGNLVGVLIEAIKEQNTKIGELEKKIETLNTIIGK